MHRLSFLTSLVAMVALLLVLWVPVHAQDATPLATPQGADIHIETLLESTIEALPGERAIVALDRWRLRPSPTPLRMPALGGPMFMIVEAGTIIVTVGGAEQRIAAGEQLVVAGDAGGTFRAAGTEEAIAFRVFVVPSFAATGGRVVGEPGATSSWEYDPLVYSFDILLETSVEGLPGGSVRLVLEQLMVPPGSALPPQEASPLVWVAVGEGVLGLMLEGERLPFRWKSGAERKFRFAQFLPPLQPGTRMTLRNAGDDPLVLYRLTLTPGAGEASAAGTPPHGTPVSG